MSYWTPNQHINPLFDPDAPVGFINSAGDYADPAEHCGMRLNRLEQAHQDQLEINREQNKTNSEFRVDLDESKHIRRGDRKEYLDAQEYGREKQKKAFALYEKVHSKVDAHYEEFKDLLKRVKDLEDQVAAQASVSTTVAHATGTDDAPTPTSASAVDLITFSPVTNDPEASLGPNGHPADTLAEPQQARTPVLVQTALAHADPPVNMQRFAQREKKVVRFQLGEGGLKHSGALSSPDPLALGVTPQKNKIPPLAKFVTQKSAAALDKFKLGRLGEAGHDEDEEHENIATVSNNPRLSAPLTHTNIAGPAKTVLHAASSMPNTLFAETPTKSAPVEPKSSPSAPSTSPLVYGPAPAVILSPAMPNTESEAPKSDAAVEDGSTSEQSKHATMTETKVPCRDMDSASLVYADGVAGETSEEAGVRKSTRERKPKRDLGGEVYGSVRVKRARK